MERVTGLLIDQIYEAHEEINALDEKVGKLYRVGKEVGV